MRFPPPDPPGSLARAGLHLAGLSAFAVAQPLFDLLSRNAEFFAVRGSSRSDIVLFAVGLVLLPPLLLVAAEALAGLVHARAPTVLHLVFVAGLAGLFVLQAIRGLDASSPVLFALAGAVGAASALLYARARPARVLLSVVGAAPVVFAGVFLLVSPVSRLVLAATPEPRAGAVAAEAPVVVVVLDELPTVSLLREDGELDAVRYPSFARLAADGTWYRNATTVHEWTTGAVPALLTGRFPSGLPILLDHPDNLFTLLGASYRLNVFESQTHLCPPERCDRDRPSLPRRVGSLLSDLSIVYGHIALPEETASRLPSIAGAWKDFGRGSGPAALLQQGPSEPGERPAAYTGRDAEVQEFVEALGPSDRPALSFLHVLLPHHPWEYLPNGKVYASDLGFQPGIVRERWAGDPELAVQAQQRHLLQVGYVDLALGRILDRLEETGLYDESLIVVVADHGVGFRPHGERRRIHAGNVEEIAFVPLFVKAPGQTSGRVVDEHVRTIDVLPTVADLLGIELPWETDGRSVAVGAPGPEPDIRVHTSSGEIVTAEAGEAVARRARLLARQVELFGDEDDVPGLYGVGPRPELLGSEVDALLVRAAAGVSFESYGGEPVTYDPESPFAPVRVYGELHGVAGPQDVAVAVNGQIVATTRSFEHSGVTYVSALAPEEAFRPGENAVSVYLVAGEGEGAVLTEAPPAS